MVSSLHDSLTFKTGLDFSAMDFKSSMAPFTAVEALEALWGAKAAAEPARVAKRTTFMVETLLFFGREMQESEMIPAVVQGCPVSADDTQRSAILKLQVFES